MNLDVLLIALPRLPEVALPEAAGLTCWRTPSLCAAISRRAGELPCRKCGLCDNEARLTIVCHPCYRAVHHLADHWPGDDVVLRRWAQLEELGLIAT